MSNDLQALLERALEQAKARQWRRENPYVADLIEVLKPHANGLARRAAIRAMGRLREGKALPVPDNFEQTVQSSFNQHCAQSQVFKKRNSPADALFSSTLNKGTAVWRVDLERATAWLTGRNKEP